MQDRLLQIIQKELKKLSDISSPPLTVSRFNEIPLQKELWCIVLELRGRTHGFFSIILSSELAKDLSLQIIHKALDGNFDQGMLDADLSKNTIGEFGNIVLGEFFRDEKHEKSTYIAAPRYSDIQNERELVQEAEHCFRLDILGKTCFFAWRMKTE